MKISSLIVVFCGLLVCLCPAQAQVWNNVTSGNWQSATWGIGETFPGSTNSSMSATIAPNSDITITNATPPAAIGNLTILNTSGSYSITLLGSGTLTINGDLTVDNALIIGAGLRVVVNGSVRGSAPILVSSGGLLRLTSTSTTAIHSTASIAVPTSVAGGTIELAAGWNAGFLPGAVFGNAARPFHGTVRIGGTFTLSSPLVIGTSGRFDFSTTATRLILASSATIMGNVVNAGVTRYFVTTAYPLVLGNVGSTLFPVGPSPTVFTPLVITNNAAPATFSVKALPFVTQLGTFATNSTRLRQSIVNQQWNVSQLTGVTPGFAVSISPLWLPSQENAGFNRSIAVTNAFTTTSGTISSGAEMAASDPTFFGYFRSGVTVTQNATNTLNNTPILVSSQPAPAILAFTPPCQSSGGTLSITGSRFAPGARVSIGGVTVVAGGTTLISGGSSGIDTLRVVVPSNAQSGSVTVTQTGGTSTGNGYGCGGGGALQPAGIFRVTPNPIPAGIGDIEVVIEGAAFGVLTPRVIAVGSGFTSTITPRMNSSARIVATIPGGVVRNVGIVVLTVTSLDRLPVSTTVTVSMPPYITLTRLFPSVTTSNLQPFTIRVEGNTFSSQSLFTLGKDTLRVVDVSRNSDGSLTAVVIAPMGIQSGNLTVTNLNKQTASLPFVVGTVGVFAEPTPTMFVFPNPVEDIVSVQAHHLNAATIFITITNVFGQCVHLSEQPVVGGQYNRSVNLSSLPSGVYLLEIRAGTQRTVQKILKR